MHMPARPFMMTGGRAMIIMTGKSTSRLVGRAARASEIPARVKRRSRLREHGVSAGAASLLPWQFRA